MHPALQDKGTLWSAPFSVKSDNAVSSKSFRLSAPTRTGPPEPSPVFWRPFRISLWACSALRATEAI